MKVQWYANYHTARAGLKPIGPIAPNWALRLRGPRANFPYFVQKYEFALLNTDFKKKTFALLNTDFF